MPGTGDFEGCRFDFRIDSKKGLMPSRRKGRSANSNIGSDNRVNSVVGLQGTLFTCKQCGVLLVDRQALTEHKLTVHRPTTTRNRLSATGNRPTSLPRSTVVSSLSSVGSGSNSLAFHESSVVSPMFTCKSVTSATSVLPSPEMADAERQTTVPSVSVIQRYINGLLAQRQLTTQTVENQPVGVHVERVMIPASPPGNDVIERTTPSRDVCPTTERQQPKGSQLKATVDRLWRNKLNKLSTAASEIDGGSSPLEGNYGHVTGTPSQDIISKPVTENTGAVRHQYDKPLGGSPALLKLLGCDSQEVVDRQGLTATAECNVQPQFYTSRWRLQTTQSAQDKETTQIDRTLKIRVRKTSGMRKLRSRNSSVDVRLQHQTRVSITATQMSSSVGDHEADSSQYSCDFDGCRRTFRELKHLKVHRMQHTDERPLACSLCNYACRQRNSLNWHMKSRHGLAKHVTQDGRTVYIGGPVHR